MKSIFQQLSYHILSAVSLSFVIGIASTSLVQQLPISPTAVITVLGFLFILIALLQLLQKKQTVISLILFLFFGIGFLHTQLGSVPPQAKIHIWNTIINKQEGVIIGTLLSMPEYNETTSKIIVSAKYLRLSNWDTFSPAIGKILLRMEAPWPAQFLPGDTLILRADLKRPTSYNSPGSFDFSQYLARKNIWITGFIRSPLFVKKLSENTPFFHQMRF